MKTPETIDGTQEKILQVTVELIRSGGYSGDLTVRQIALTAGGNVWCVNYYFGAKDDLIDAAIRIIVEDVLDSLNSLDDKSVGPVERLSNFFVHVTKTVLSCHISPGTLMFHKRKHGFKSKHEVMAYFREIGFGKVQNTIKEITGDPDDGRAYLLFLQILAALIMPNIMMRHTTKAPRIELPAIEEQVNRLFARIFHENSGGSQ
jgi:AcrR family transcriptional regulator